MTQLGTFIVLVGILMVAGIIYGLIHSLISLHRWSKSGFCRHQWQIYNTCSFGQHHWYKCEKCQEKRLR